MNDNLFEWLFLIREIAAPNAFFPGVANSKSLQVDGRPHPLTACMLAKCHGSVPFIQKFSF